MCRSYKLVGGCAWDTDKVESVTRWVTGKVGLYERSFSDCSVHLITVPLFLCLYYKPFLNKPEPGNDDSHVSCHQPEVLWKIIILLFIGGKKNKCRVIITINHCNWGPLLGFSKIHEVLYLSFLLFDSNFIHWVDCWNSMTINIVLKEENLFKVQIKRIFEF